jgi:hypothetical protein
MNQHRVTNICWYSTALMVLTSIHHIYGAVIYHTPWRLHVLMLSIPVIILTIVLYRVLRQKETINRSFVFWIFFLVTLVPSIGLIGLYEGVYNHMLKNVLFFGGVDRGTLLMLFPAPAYEMPNDLLFEITGVLQGLIVIPLIVKMIALILSLFKSTY